VVRVLERSDGVLGYAGAKPQRLLVDEVRKCVTGQMRIVEVPRHLTGEMRSAAIKLAVDDDSSTGTRPDGQRDQAAFSMAGTESPFADSGKVATVLDIDRQDFALQLGPQFAPLAVILGTILIPLDGVGACAIPGNAYGRTVQYAVGHHSAGISQSI